MISKFMDTALQAVGDVADGSVVLVGGFGAVGQPNALIEALIEQGARDLTIVANNAGAGRHGLARLLELRRVRKIVCSFPRSPGSVVFEELHERGEIELEIVPQGTIAERLRAAGAGVAAFYTQTGVGTLMAEGKELRRIGETDCLLEYALHGDLALIEAWAADRWGNLVYRASARNFNPVMAMAGRLTVAQVRETVELGRMDAEAVVTPGIFVDRVVCVPDAMPRLF